MLLYKTQQNNKIEKLSFEVSRGCSKQGIKLWRMQYTDKGFLSSPFFCLPPSGILMKRENKRMQALQKSGETNKNRTEQDKTKHNGLLKISY